MDRTGAQSSVGFDSERGPIANKQRNLRLHQDRFGERLRVEFRDEKKNEGNPSLRTPSGDAEKPCGRDEAGRREGREVGELSDCRELAWRGKHHIPSDDQPSEIVNPSPVPVT